MALIACTTIYLRVSFPQCPQSNTYQHIYVQDYVDHEGSTSIIFSLPEKVGALAEALKVFEVRSQMCVSL